MLPLVENRQVYYIYICISQNFVHEMKSSIYLCSSCSNKSMIVFYTHTHTRARPRALKNIKHAQEGRLIFTRSPSILVFELFYRLPECFYSLLHSHRWCSYNRFEGRIVKSCRSRPRSRAH